MVKKIKILHISKPVGGVGTYIEILDKYLNNELYENIITYNKKEDIISDFLNKKMLLHVSLVRNISIINDIKATIEVYRIIKKEKPDIIHCHSSKAGIVGRIVGRLTNIKTVYTPHSYYYIGQKSLKRQFFMLIEKAIQYISNSNILACSKSESDRSLNDLKMPTDKITIWNNSIPPSKERTSLGARLKFNYICSIARPSTQKNLLLALKAFNLFHKSYPEVKYYIIGVGHYSDQLEDIRKYIKDKNLNDAVELIEWMDRKETLNMLNNALIYLSTSLYEGLPYSLIEALSFGVPIVATNCDGNKDLVDDGITGFLTNYEPEYIFNKIEEIYKNQDKYEEFKKNSLSKFEEFNIFKNVNRLECYYRNLIK